MTLHLMTSYAKIKTSKLKKREYKRYDVIGMTSYI